MSMSTGKKTIVKQVSAVFEVTIHEGAPDDLFSRMANDEELYSALYGKMTEQEVYAHWAHNAVANGVEDVSRLDGWADVPKYAVQFDVSNVEIEA